MILVGSSLLLWGATYIWKQWWCVWWYRGDYVNNVDNDVDDHHDIDDDNNYEDNVVDDDHEIDNDDIDDAMLTRLSSSTGCLALEQSIQPSLYTW